MNLENIWVYIGSFVSLVAVAFFAIWSISSNIISGILIYLTNPFKIGSKLKMFDPEFTATVKEVNLLFTRLEDDSGVFNVPNSSFSKRQLKF